MTLLPPVEHYLGVGPLFHDIIPSKTILVEWPLRGLLTATLGCDCSEAALFWPNVLQTPKIKTVKMGNWIIDWKKIHLTDLVKDEKLVG